MRAKTRKTRKILLLLVVTASLLCGCKGEENGSSKSKEIRVGVLLYNQDDMFINILKQKLDETFREKERKENLKITVNFSDAQRNQTVQNDQIDRFIAQNYDVLCVNIVDRTDAAIIIDKAKKAEIPVIFFNREPVFADMQRWKDTYYVGTDAAEGGEFQGEIFIEQYKKEKKDFDRNGDGVIQYVLLEGEQGHQDTTIRTESCIKTIREAGIHMERLATASADWRRSQGKEKMESWLDEFGEDAIEALISNNDEMALGALEAIEQREIPDNKIKIIGLDGIEDAQEAVKNGKMVGTVLNNADGQADAIVDLAIEIGKNRGSQTESDVENRIIRISHQFLTQDNEEQ